MQRDLLMGALAALGLASDPLSQNRYVLAGANPISYVEIDGHRAENKEIGGCLDTDRRLGDGIQNSKEANYLDYASQRCMRNAGYNGTQGWPQGSACGGESVADYVVRLIKCMIHCSTNIDDRFAGANNTRQRIGEFSVTKEGLLVITIGSAARKAGTSCGDGAATGALSAGAATAVFGCATSIAIDIGKTQDGRN